MSAATYALLSVALVSVVSLVGAVGLAFGALRRHGVMMALIALAAGTLLGDALLHLLPEASHDGGFTAALGGLVLAGFMAMFTIEVVLRRGHSHAEHVGHHDHIAAFGWLNLVGDGLHNFIDGVILAAAYLVDPAAGFATTVAVVLHEVPQEMGDFAVLVRSGMSHKRALLLNLASALVAFAGAATVLLLPIEAETLQHTAVPLIAGAFIYIAAADLVPELHHHGRPRDLVRIMVALAAGLLMMAALLVIGDPAHA